MSDVGRTRFWRLVSGGFVILGCLALCERLWTLSADWHARRTWPSADGEIVSATQQDDRDVSRRYGGTSGRTRYWLEYEVRFAAPPGQCRTSVLSRGLSQSMPCRGMVKTRSTQSTAEVFQWLLHGYQVNQPVRVLWNPDAPGSSNVKIVGEPLSLWYNLDRLTLTVLWVLGFGAWFVWSQTRLASLTRAHETMA